jgi:hypothetical protein
MISRKIQFEFGMIRFYQTSQKEGNFSPIIVSFTSNSKRLQSR